MPKTEATKHPHGCECDACLPEYARLGKSETTRGHRYASGKYRVRRGLFGGCVLQEWQNYPNIEMREWKNVPWRDAPDLLKEISNA